MKRPIPKPFSVHVTERVGGSDDKASDALMGDLKKAGYF